MESKSNEFEFDDSVWDKVANYYEHLSDLATGKKRPSSKSGRQFVDVCHGKKEPQTAIEKLWAFLNTNSLSDRFCGRCRLPMKCLNGVPNTYRCVRCQSNFKISESVGRADDNLVCPRCKIAKLVWKYPRDKTKSARFLACSAYPTCLYVDKSGGGNSPPHPRT